mmetsp:Transcript_19135/g.53574  ORF Transcript_19135/g.53574 Transcript_19135/m.53574 type:complete len:679 (+) Transcript_19135:132-2168(+)|eukprot:CAMPEP_0202388928 /NCGR_PEP_ID=MMETSP1127-20130417/80227_1 /ASSEMBLY_ACC=CAM_ASM_000462 /TAXON_ID=3047 /ORGANISM="Dunaliella tertiolecta, Strain CCMP1320" /LENGTH=678 /DNA_ID=CAMNT_0048990521 /DNA_START=521 /DNA_END=2557 /DNA_ORIENTATION=-
MLGGLWRHGASPLHASSACITDLLSAAARAAGGGKALIPADIKEHSCSNWSDASSQGVQWGGTNEQVEHASAASPSTTAISSSSSNLHSTHPFSRNHKHGSSNSISSSNSVSSSSSSNSSCSNSRGSLLATSHSVSQNAHHAESHAPLEQGTCRHLPSLSPRNLFLGLSAAACTGLHSNASPLGNIFLCTASPPFTLQGPARQFHAWYYASRNMDHEIRVLDSLEAVEAFWDEHGQPPAPLPPLPLPAHRHRVAQRDSRPAASVRLSHINLVRLLHRLSLMPQEGPLADDVEGRVNVLAGELCEQLRHRVKWMDPRFAGVALVALGRLGWTADTQLVDELLNRAKARMPEAYMRDLARIAHGLWMLGTHFPEGPAPGSASAWWPAAFQKAELAISAGKAPPPTVTRLLWCASSLQQAPPATLLLAVASDAAHRPAAYASLHTSLSPTSAMQALQHMAAGGSAAASSTKGSAAPPGVSDATKLFGVSSAKLSGEIDMEGQAGKQAGSTVGRPGTGGGEEEASLSGVAGGGPLRIRTPASELLQALSRWQRAAPDQLPKQVWEALSPEALGRQADAAAAQLADTSKEPVLTSKKVARDLGLLETAAGAAALVPFRSRKQWLSQRSPSIQQLESSMTQVVAAMSPHQAVVAAAAWALLEHTPSHQLSQAFKSTLARTQGLL